MITTDDPKVLSRWLMENFVPSGKTALAGWKQLVRRQLAPSTLPGLIRLVVGGNDEERYQAAAAARTLGAEIWAADDDLAAWDVKLPGQRRSRRITAANMAAVHSSLNA